MIKRLPPNLQTSALLAQYLPFDAMVSTIEPVIRANVHENSQDAHRQYRGREFLQIMNEEEAEEQLSTRIRANVMIIARTLMFGIRKESAWRLSPLALVRMSYPSRSQAASHLLGAKGQ